MLMGNRRRDMNNHLELSRPNWNAAVKLAVVISIVAGFAAVVASAASDVPQSAIVLSVIVVGFTASWILTNRLRRGHG